MLTAHAGAQRITQEEVRAVPIPEREDVSTRWRGISHDELLSQIFKSSTDRGLVTTRDEWALKDEGNTLFGSIDFESQGVIEMPAGVGLSLGLRHSNVGEYALTFVVGGRVFVCDNGAIQGEFVVKRKHTIGVSLPELVEEGMDQYLAQAVEVGKFIETFKQTPCMDGDACQYMLQAGRLGVMPWGALDAVANHWYNPPHHEFSDRTRWSLYNAFTEVIRERSPVRQMMEISQVSGILATSPDAGLVN